MASLADDGVPTPSAQAGVRLYAGSAVSLDLGFGGGRYTDTDMRQDWVFAEEGGVILDREDTTELEGWRMSASGRLLVRIASGDDLTWRLGVSGAWQQESAQGPMYEDVEQEDGTTEIEEVGQANASDRRLSAGPSLCAEHWLSERISVSGLLDLVVLSTRTLDSTERLLSDGELVPSDRDQYKDEAIGFFPRVGLAVHLRL
ncbi:MAG: hypothetical protein ACI8S6_001030 [Myxococcota bacterium]|jgi:hypothetical protein